MNFEERSTAVIQFHTPGAPKTTRIRQCRRTKYDNYIDSHTWRAQKNVYWWGPELKNTPKGVFVCFLFLALAFKSKGEGLRQASKNKVRHLDSFIQIMRNNLKHSSMARHEVRHLYSFAYLARRSLEDSSISMHGVRHLHRFAHIVRDTFRFLARAGKEKTSNQMCFRFPVLALGFKLKG